MLSFWPSEPNDANAHQDLAGAVWIDLQSPDAHEIEAVQGATGLGLPSRFALSEVEVSSRLRRVGGVVYLSASLVAGAEGDSPFLSPVGFVLDDRRLITVRFDPFAAFDKAVAEARDADPGGMTSYGAFVGLLEAIVDRNADLLELAGVELEGLSRAAFHRDGKGSSERRSNAFQRDALASVGRVGDRLSQIRDALLGLGRIVPFVREVHCHGQPEDILARLKAISQDVASLNEYEAHLAYKVQFLLDAILGFITISQNDIFKVLTVVSVVGIPPTLIAGIYGMNFKIMPELQWRLGYPYGLLVIALSALLPLAWFKWKDWL